MATDQDTRFPALCSVLHPSQLPVSRLPPSLQTCAHLPCCSAPQQRELLPGGSPSECHLGSRGGMGVLGVYTQGHHGTGHQVRVIITSTTTIIQPNVYSFSSFCIREGRKSWGSCIPAFQGSDGSLEKLRAEAFIIKTSPRPA